MATAPVLYFTVNLPEQRILIADSIYQQMFIAELHSLEQTDSWCRFCYDFMEPSLVSELCPFSLVTSLNTFGLWGLANSKLVSPFHKMWDTFHLSYQSHSQQAVKTIEAARLAIRPLAIYEGNDMDAASAKAELDRAEKALAEVDQALIETVASVPAPGAQLVHFILSLRSVYALTRAALRIRLNGKKDKVALTHAWNACLYFDALRYFNNLAESLFTRFRQIQVATGKIGHIEITPPPSMLYAGNVKIWLSDEIDAAEEEKKEKRHHFCKALERFDEGKLFTRIYNELLETLDIPRSGGYAFELPFWEFVENHPSSPLGDNLREEMRLISRLMHERRELNWQAHMIRNLAALFLGLCAGMGFANLYVRYTGPVKDEFWLYPHWLVAFLGGMALVAPARRLLPPSTRRSTFMATAILALAGVGLYYLTNLYLDAFQHWQAG